MSFLLSKDTVNGALGTAYLTVNGQQVELVGFKNIQALASIQSSDMKCVGTNAVQDKPNGAKQTGKGNIYYGSNGSNRFRDMVLNYITTGQITYFDIQIDNTDPSVSMGNQVSAYYDCHLTGDIPLSILDSEESMLNYDFNFAYSRVAMIQKFSDPTNVGTIQTPSTT